jgi:transposase, IS5 family
VRLLGDLNTETFAMKKQLPGSFVSVDVSRRTRKSRFFHQINAVIDWAVFEKELYKVCKRSIADAAGRPAYNPLVLFKMMLLQTWYNLSELGVEDTVPDHSTLSRFRSALTEKRAMHRLLLNSIHNLRTRVFWYSKVAVS